MKENEPRVLVIRTDFKHHGDSYGYKQILKFTRPSKIIGIDERNPDARTSSINSKYLWLFEFQAFRMRKGIDLIHILYGEDYYRFSKILFKTTPVVATFHQPVATLEREIFKGDIRGRVGRITHLLSPNRFKRLDAAIVTSPSQIEVLKKVMPAEKIHYIPLGTHITELNAKFQADQYQNRIGGKVITVGSWMRDWDFYLKVVEQCSGIQFHLVDRKISPELRAIVSSLKNVTYYPDLNDEDLYALYLTASCQFLPVLGIAGSNAFLQGLALGCPTVVTEFGHAGEEAGTDFIIHYQKDDINDCIKKLKSISELSLQSRRTTAMQANMYANQFSWESVAGKTLELYKKLVNSK